MVRAYFEHGRASHLVDASIAPIIPCGLGSIRLARMRIELARLYRPGSPQAEGRVRFGLREGPPNQHPDTAQRTGVLPFRMIELLWVSNAQEAQSEDPRRTLLWERWSGREGESSPFGVTASKTHATFRNRRSGVHLGVNRLKRASRKDLASSILLFSKTRAGYRKSLPSYTIGPHFNTGGGNNVKSTECASADT